MDKFICTILVPTIRVKKFIDLCNSIEACCDTLKEHINVVAIIDRSDIEVELSDILSNHKFTITINIHRFLNPHGQYGIYKGINEAIFSFKSNWYQITSDDIKYIKHNWHIYLNNLKIPNHGICRIKNSSNKKYNIKNPVDAIIKPDCFPYLSEKYIQYLGTTGDCYGSDTFFEGISYYVNNIITSFNPFNNDLINFDLTIYDSFYDQPDFGTDLDDDHKNISRFIMLLEWFRLLSKPYQEMLLQKAILLAKYILTYDSFKLVEAKKNYLLFKRGSSIKIRRKIYITEILTLFYARLFIIYYLLIFIFSLYKVNLSFNIQITSIKTRNLIFKKAFALLKEMASFIKILILWINNQYKYRFKKMSITISSRKLRSTKPVAIFLSQHPMGIMATKILQHKLPYLKKFLNAKD